MRKAVVRVGSLYVIDAPITFGYTNLSNKIKEAKIFNDFDEASNYVSLLDMECEIDALDLI